MHLYNWSPKTGQSVYTCTHSHDCKTIQLQVLNYSTVVANFCVNPRFHPSDAAWKIPNPAQVISCWARQYKLPATLIITIYMINFNNSTDLSTTIAPNIHIQTNQTSHNFCSVITKVHLGELFCLICKGTQKNFTG